LHESSSLKRSPDAHGPWAVFGRDRSPWNREPPRGTLSDLLRAGAPLDEALRDREPLFMARIHEERVLNRHGDLIAD
jgi:hypothetical protein